MQKQGASNEIWRLDLEKAIQYAQNPARHLNNTKIWQQIKSDLFGRRYGHSSEFIFPNHIVILGGLNENNQTILDPLLFQVTDQKFTSLKKKFSISGGIPSERSFFALNHNGNGFLTLYGGMNSNNATLNDVWHLRVDTATNQIDGMLVYQNQASDDKYENIITSRAGSQWLQVPFQEFPVAFGSVSSDFYLDSSDLLILKDQRCQTNQESDSLQCLPCPQGSVLSKGRCVYCGKESYWLFDPNNVFGSVCEPCPEGTEHGIFQEFGCSPCSEGQFYKSSNARCTECQSTEICPVGSATSFPVELQEEFSKIINRNDPPLYQNTAELSKVSDQLFS